MVNILMALRLFAKLWSTKKILKQCDNQAVVTVLRSGKTRDAFLAASARNIWYLTALHDIDLQFTHIRGASNQLADILSKWQGSVQQIQFLQSQVSDPVWFASVSGSTRVRSLFVVVIQVSVMCMC